MAGTGVEEGLGVVRVKPQYAVRYALSANESTQTARLPGGYRHTPGERRKLKSQAGHYMGKKSRWVLLVGMAQGVASMRGSVVRRVMGVAILALLGGGAKQVARLTPISARISLRVYISLG